MTGLESCVSRNCRTITHGLRAGAGAAVALAVSPAHAQARLDPASYTNDPLVWALGALALILAVATISYRQRAVLARRDRARLEAILRREREIQAVSPNQFYCWDLAGGTEEASPNLSSLLGLPRGRQPQPADILALFAEDDVTRLSQHLEDLRTAGKGFDLVLPTADDARVLRLAGAASGFSDGRPAAAILWLGDQTGRARAEAALGAEISGLRKLLDYLPIPVWRRDESLALAYANRAFARSVEAEPGTPTDRLRELGASGRELAKQAAASGELRGEEQHIVIDGARRRIEIKEGPLPGERTIAGYALDHTDIEDVRAELSRHIAGHEEVLHRLGTAVAIYDPDQRVKFFNHAFVHLWQLDELWLRSEPTMGEILEALREARRLPEVANFPVYKAEQINMFTSLLDSVEELIHLPDGTTLRAVVTPHPFGGLLLTWEDVTDALALERSYNTLMDVQRETLDHLYEGVAVIGADGRLQLSNPAFARIWRLDEALLSAEPHMSDIVEAMRPLLEDETDWAELKETVMGRLTDRGGRTERIERSDGSVVDLASVPLPDGAVLLSYIDVTDSIQVERVLRERNEALETADRLKSEFIASVSYELRTPLNTIIGFSEILNGKYFGDLNDRQVEYAEGILDSSQHLLTLINDILDLAMIESGRMVLELGRTEISPMIRSVTDLMGEQVLQKNLRLDVDYPDDIGAILADERRLKQALFAILSNAVKFTPENGTITVTAGREGENLILSVTDTGIGMSEADRSRAFERFERGDSPEARRSGVGLGLSLVKSFIELHEGRVSLESHPGAGTTVRCSLPARAAEEEPVARSAAG